MKKLSKTRKAENNNKNDKKEYFALSYKINLNTTFISVNNLQLKLQLKDCRRTFCQKASHFIGAKQKMARCCDS